jgi:hypothetical protein
LVTEKAHWTADGWVAKKAVRRVAQKDDPKADGWAVQMVRQKVGQMAEH